MLNIFLLKYTCEISPILRTQYGYERNANNTVCAERCVLAHGNISGAAIMTLTFILNWNVS